MPSSKNSHLDVKLALISPHFPLDKKEVNPYKLYYQKYWGVAQLVRASDC